MAEKAQKRGVIKFCFWGVIGVALSLYWVLSYSSGTMVRWYYYTAKSNGYAINSETFAKASKDNPAVLEVGNFEAIEGLKAVPVKKGDRLPINANGIIDEKTLKDGKRAALEGNRIKVIRPWEIKESKGFKYKDTFKHKGIKTNPWSGLWNVVMVIGLGISLGFMAEGFTDLLGIRLKKIDHYGH